MKITLNNVTKTIKGVTVIDHVNMTLESGKVFGLRGHNGCGKTMLMRLISGLIYPTQGEITFDGKALGKDMDFPESMGVMIENPAFLGGYTGLQNLELLASIRGNASKLQLRHALDRVGLAPDDTRKFRKYSLGMQQRLGIAAAIAEAPALILLDEPSNALDTEGIEMLRKMIQEERERGALILMTCHDNALLEALCDEIFKIENGKVLQTSAETRKEKAA